MEKVLEGAIEEDVDGELSRDPSIVFSKKSYVEEPENIFNTESKSPKSN
jgi:hypothetical protein